MASQCDGNTQHSHKPDSAVPRLSRYPQSGWSNKAHGAGDRGNAGNVAVRIETPKIFASERFWHSDFARRTAALPGLA